MEADAAPGPGPRAAVSNSTTSTWARFLAEREAVGSPISFANSPAEHSAVGDNIVVRHATDAATQARVRDALQHSLDAWWQFFDGIQAAI